MKILFVHHGSFSANSMNHIGPFAAELKKQGHETGIALPDLDPSFQFFPYPEVSVFSFDDFLKNPNRFDGEPPQIVHAWTPREVVRQFCEKLWQKIDTHLVVHLEDDEIAVARPGMVKEEDYLHRTDPLHGPWFLELADTFTIITEGLAKYVPKNKPTLLLHPGFDKSAVRNNKFPSVSRKTFGIPEDYKIITYPGGASGANSEDLYDLYHAVHILNTHGTPCILLKTGFPDPEVRKPLPGGADSWIRDVGFLKREEMWRLVELADIVVQPGRINNYNRNRLPSKLPDFLCLSKPIITTSANLGKSLVDGEHALLLKKSNAKEIAARCQELFSNPELANKLSKAGHRLGANLFDLSKNTAGLVRFYDTTLKAAQNELRIYAGDQIKKAISILEKEFTEIKAPSSEALKIRSYLKSIRRSARKTTSKKAEVETPQIECQIYYPNQPSVLELGSLRHWYSLKSIKSWLVPFSPPQMLPWLRIDPGQFPGTYIIKSWEFLDNDQKSLFRWTPDLLKSVTCQLTGASMGPVSEDGLEIWSLTHDPQMLFAPLPNLDTQKICWFKLNMTAKEIESPLTKPLRLNRKGDPDEAPQESHQDWTETIDSLLATLDRRRSPVLRMIDRMRQKIKS